MNHGSLFSGIGGFDLAAQQIGWTNIFHCEKNEFCQKILKHHYPESTLHEDITKTDFTIYKGKIDILTGGFPCQPFSSAGRKRGISDDRYLWPEMLRAIQEIQPRWIVGENVRVLVNFSGGLVFEQMCSDLENERYEVLPTIIPASGVGAPHQRERIWFIAYNGSDSNKLNGYLSGFHSSRVSQFKKTEIFKNIITDSNKIGLEGREKSTSRKGELAINRNYWDVFPTQSAICDRNDGISYKLYGISFPKWRNESIKSLGNAVVPQVCFQIFKAIQKYELS